MFEKKQDSFVKAVNLAFEGICISLCVIVLALLFCKNGSLISIFSAQDFSVIIIFLAFGAIFPLIIETITKIAKNVRLSPKSLEKCYSKAEIIRGNRNVVPVSYVETVQASNSKPLDNISLGNGKPSQHTVPEVAPETDNVSRCITGSPRANSIFEFLGKEV